MVPSQAPAAPPAAVVVVVVPAAGSRPLPPAALAVSSHPFFFSLLLLAASKVFFSAFVVVVILVADALPAAKAAAVAIEVEVVVVVCVCHLLVVIVIEFINEARASSSSLLLVLLLLPAAAREVTVVFAVIGGRRGQSCLCSRARACCAVAVASSSVVCVLGGAPLQLLDLRPDLLAPGGVLERQGNVRAQGSVGPRDDRGVALSRVCRSGGSGRAAIAPLSVRGAAARGTEPVDQERPRVLLGDDDEPGRVGLLVCFCFVGVAEREGESGREEVEVGKKREIVFRSMAGKKRRWISGAPTRLFICVSCYRASTLRGLDAGAERREIEKKACATEGTVGDRKLNADDADDDPALDVSAVVRRR